MATNLQPPVPRSLLVSTAFAWAGALACFLLIQASTSGHHRLCPLQWDCQAVLTSKYAAFLGIPLSWLGAAFYVAMLLLLLVALAVKSSSSRSKILLLALWMSVAGLTFAVGLVYLQLSVIHAFCSLCALSTLILVGLAIGLGVAVRSEAEDFHGAPSMAGALAAFAIVGSAGFYLATYASKEEVIAEVGGRKFLRREMERDLRRETQPFKKKIGDLEAQWVQKRIDDTVLALEAKKRGVSVREMLSKLNGEKAEVPMPPGADVNAADRTGAKRRFLDELTKIYGARSYLTSRNREPIAIDLTNAQIAGPADAKVELVVFSDFTCQFCIQLAPVLKKVRETFPKEVLIAFRDFPLGEGGQGFAAAVAGKCAAEQGAFWEFHDRLFAENGVLPADRLVAVAVSLGMDEQRFAQCLRADRPRNAVRASMEDALRIGVPGAPALFLNGVLIGGAIDYPTLEKKIRAELKETTW